MTESYRPGYMSIEHGKTVICRIVAQRKPPFLTFLTIENPEIPPPPPETHVWAKAIQLGNDSIKVEKVTFCQYSIRQKRSIL